MLLLLLLLMQHHLQVQDQVSPNHANASSSTPMSLAPHYHHSRVTHVISVEAYDGVTGEEACGDKLCEDGARCVFLCVFVRV